jgi:hypothetical protein
MTTKWGLLFTTFLVGTSLLGQNTTKTVNEVEQAWLGLFSQTRLSAHWGIWLDVHQRQTDHFFGRPSQTFIRPAAIYYWNENTRVMAGYAFVWFYKAPQDQAGHQEHRPWQQLWWRQNYARFGSTQWLRLEERFVQKVKNGEPSQDYTFNWRVRYSYTLNIPLNNTKWPLKHGRSPCKTNYLSILGSRSPIIILIRIACLEELDINSPNN